VSARIKDVAKLAGVSSATVSRVLSNKPHVRASIKARVLAAVEELSYEPNRVARSLRVQRSSIIGLVISDIQNSFFNTIVRAIEDSAYKHGYAVFLCNTDENSDKETFYLNLLKAERVAGIILTPAQENSETCEAIKKAGIPIITIDRKLNNVDLDSVLTDNKAASKALVSHLIKDGHKDIAMIGPKLEITTGYERFEGYKAALKTHNLKFNQEIVRIGEPVEEDGYQFAQELLNLPKRPDALFVATKLMTIGALRAITEKGLRIPNDIALAGFDQLDWMPYIPELAHGKQPTYQLGQKAANLLLERIANPEKDVEHLVLKSELVLPKSSDIAKEALSV